MSRTVALHYSLALVLGASRQSAEPRSDAPIAWAGGAFNFNLAAGACELDARRIAVAVNVHGLLAREPGPKFRSSLKDRPLLGQIGDVLFRVLDRETAEVLHEHAFGGGGIENVLDLVSLGDGQIGACGPTTSPRLTDRTGWFRLASGSDAWLAMIELTGEAPRRS